MLFTGFLSFVFGFSLKTRKLNLDRFKLYSKNYLWNEKRLYTLILIFSLVSFTGIVLFVRAIGVASIFADISGKRYGSVEGSTNNLVTSYGYFQIMANFIQPALYIYTLNFILTSKKILSINGFVLIMLLIANLFFPFFTSSRSDLMVVFLNLVILISFTGKLTLRLIFPSSLAILLLFSIITLLRPVKATTSSINLENISFFDPFIYNKNLLDVSKTAHIINAVPQKMQFQYGASYLSVLYAPIPRVWRPDKPALSMSKDISHKVYGYKENALAGIPPGIAAEFYINFGYAGILIGFFLVGIMIKKLYCGFNFSAGLSKNLHYFICGCCSCRYCKVIWQFF